MKRRIILLIVLLVSLTVSAEAAGKLYLNSNTTYINAKVYLSEYTVPTDKNASTATLLHFDDLNSPRKDETGRTWAITGAGAVHYNYSGKYGGCLSFSNAVLGYISTPDSASFTYDAYWTIDFWVNQATNNDGLLFSQLTTGYADGVYVRSSCSYIQCACYKPGGWVSIMVAPIPREQWVHLAVVCDNYIVTFYINGVARGSGRLNTSSLPNPSTAFCIGGNPESPAINLAGKIDEFRFQDGARWTSNFTPPTSGALYETKYPAKLILR